MANENSSFRITSRGVIMFKFKVRQIFFFLVSGLLVGCQQPSPSPLIDDFSSQMSIQEVRLTLPLALRTWKVNIDDRPTHYVVEIDHYQSLGIAGHLSLSFIEGKLEMTCFLTKEIQRYLVQLERVKGIRLKQSLPEIGGSFHAEIGSNTSVFIFPGSEDICWRDMSSDTYWRE